MSAPDTILVVDDDGDIREVVGFALKMLGFKSDAVADGVEALRWIDEHGDPALILLDLMMPNMDGESFVRTLRARRPGALIPIVLLSGHAAVRTLAEVLAVQGCLVKPVDLNDLESAVRRFVPPREAHAPMT